MYRLIIMLLFIPILAFSGEYDSYLYGLNLSGSEKNTINSILSDVKDKKLDLSPFYMIINENKIKNYGYFELLKALIKKEEILFYLKNNNYPYKDDNNITYLLSYLLENYNISGIETLNKTVVIKKLTKDEYAYFIKYLLFYNNYDINKNIIIKIAGMLLEQNLYKKNELDSILSLYTRSKELKINPIELTTILESYLLNKMPIKKIIGDIEQKYH